MIAHVLPKIWPANLGLLAPNPSPVCANLGRNGWETRPYGKGGMVGQLLLYNPSDSLAVFLRVGRRVATKRRMVEAYDPSIYGTWAPFGTPSSFPGRHPNCAHSVLIVYLLLPVIVLAT